MFEDTYQTIDNQPTAEFKDKGSKFLAYAAAIKDTADLKHFLTQLRELHPKATHHCYAYRLGLDKLQNYRANDDGEPAGTAGRPILGQIDSHRLTNVVVVVVRYYGGVNLGVPGLINAYKNSAKLVLEQAQVVQRQLHDYYVLQFDYSLTNDVMRLLKREQVSITQQQYANDSQLIDCHFARLKSTALLDALAELRGVKATYVGTR